MLRQRDPRQIDKAHLGWVARCPCWACVLDFGRVAAVQVAHIKMGFPDLEHLGWRPFCGGEKSHDWRTSPLCPGHHLDWPNAQHRVGERAFWESRGVYAPAFVAVLVAARLAGERPGLVVILRALTAAKVSPVSARMASSPT